MISPNSSFNGKVSQTTRAHRLTMKAMQVGGSSVQQALVRLIFKAYMEEEQDIADIGNLSEMAECAGVMSKNEVIFHVFILLLRPVRHRIGYTTRSSPFSPMCLHEQI